jgi:MOSC domain-containing protein YiiM
MMALMMKLVSVQVGRPRIVPPSGDGQPWDRQWETAFWKEPVEVPVRVRRLQVEGDGQAAVDIHGGSDQAVLCYSASHYPLWRRELELPEMSPGGFGENFTIAGQDERSVCIGDVYEVGEALVQVSKPRGPCFKISWRWRRPDLLGRVEATGRHGWYARVLREGLIEAGQPLRLEARPHPEWTVGAAGQVIRFRKRRPELAAQLARCEALAEEDRGHLLRAVRSSLAG